MSALAETETTLQDAAARYGPAIVGLGQGWGTGTGVVIAPGLVLTAAHALNRPRRRRHRDADAGVADPITLSFADGARRPAAVAGSDPDLDLAVLSVDTGDATPIPLSPDAPAPRIGQAVLALANPGGRGVRVTHGFIASPDRGLRAASGRRVAGAIEHTAPLPRGSSGGPLLDLEGRLIAINVVRTQGGLIVAVHLDAEVGERIEKLAAGEAPPRPRLGVAIAPARAARELRRAVGLPEREGLLVRAVQADGPAAAAGVRRGDLIVALGDAPTPSIEELHAALAQVTGTARLGLVRGSEELAVEVAV